MSSAVRRHFASRLEPDGDALPHIGRARVEARAGARFISPAVCFGSPAAPRGHSAREPPGRCRRHGARNYGDAEREVRIWVRNGPERLPLQQHQHQQLAGGLVRSSGVPDLAPGGFSVLLGLLWLCKVAGSGWNGFGRVEVTWYCPLLLKGGCLLFHLLRLV